MAAISTWLAGRYNIHVPEGVGTVVAQGVTGVITVATGALGAVATNRWIGNRQRASMDLGVLAQAVSVAGGVLTEIVRAKDRARASIDDLDKSRDTLVESLGGGTNVPDLLTESGSINQTATKRLEEASAALNEAAEALRGFVRRYA